MLQGFAPPGKPSGGRLWDGLGGLGCAGDTSSAACGRHLPLKGKAFRGSGVRWCAGDTSSADYAPNQSFDLFRCSGRLIFQKQSTGLFLSKRSSSRASPLRRMPPSHSAPNQPFRLLRCFAWLILHKRSTGALIPKRTCSRASPLRVNPQGEGFWGGLGRLGCWGTPHPSSLRLATFPSRARLLGRSGAARVHGGGTPHTAHRTSPSACSGVAHGLFSINSPPDCSWRNAHAPGLRPFG